MHVFLYPDPDYPLGSLLNPYPSDGSPEELPSLDYPVDILLQGNVPGISRSNYVYPTNLPWPAVLGQQAPELVAHTSSAPRHVHFSDDAVLDTTNNGHSQSGASCSCDIDPAPRRPRTYRPAHGPDTVSLFPSREHHLATQPPPPLLISQEPYLANTARPIQRQHHIHQDQAAPNQHQGDNFQRAHTYGTSSNDQILNLHEEVTGEKWPNCQECEAKPFVYKYHGMQYCKACFGELCARAIKFEKH